METVQAEKPTRKEKRRLKNKLQRKKRRKSVALQRLESEETISDENCDSENSLNQIPTDQKEERLNTDSHLPVTPNEQNQQIFIERPRKIARVRIHRGLRCKKCFTLLTRDHDFELR
jgi:hypothetical protein